MSDLFTPATMTTVEHRRYNKLAHKRGEHLCAGCGRVLPYTEEYFYKSAKRRADGTIYLMSKCKMCQVRQSAVYKRRRYHADPEYRQRVIRNRRNYWDSLSPRAKKSVRRKRAVRRMAKILGA